MTERPETAPAAARGLDPISRRVLMALGLWAAGVAAASGLGLLDELPTPMIAPLVAIGIAVPTIIYFRSTALQAWAAGIGLWWLTAFHVWRIAAAGVFFWYGSQGLLPEIFVFNAGWGDLAAGLLALAVIAWPRPGRRTYWGVHVFGFVDFVVAVGTGLTFTLMGDPLMDTIRTFPLALIPLFAVGVSGTVHLIAFHQLLTGAQAAAAAHESHRHV